MPIEVRLFATLRRYAPAEAVNGVFSADGQAGCTVAELLEKIKIPAEEVHLIMVNGVGSKLETFLSAGDRVGLFPPIGGG